MLKIIKLCQTSELVSFGNNSFEGWSAFYFLTVYLYRCNKIAKKRTLTKGVTPNNTKQISTTETITNYLIFIKIHFMRRYPKFCVSGVITAEASSPQTE